MSDMLIQNEMRSILINFEVREVGIIKMPMFWKCYLY